jgi:integral membrane protein (TIGR01906 family)
MVFFDRGFYDNSFDQYGVYDELGVQGVRNTVDYLINYLTSGNTEIESIAAFDVFTPEEKAHLEDVQNLITWLKALSIAALVLLFAIIMRFRVQENFNDNVRRVLVYGAITAFALLVITFVLSLNFPAFFDVFHKVLFPQGNYTFTANHLLIKMFPQGFFNNYARKIMFHTLILGLVLLFLGSSSALAVRNPRRN